MCDKLESDNGHNVELQKAVCDEQLVTHSTALIDTSPSGREKWRKIKQTAREQYLAMLHVDGLNRITYRDLQVGVHKAYLIGGIVALPKR